MRALMLIAVAGGLMAAPQQPDSERLARLLADPNTRQNAMAQVADSAPLSVPILLSWIENPPAGFEGYQLQQLHIGMADAFSQLKTKEAIPFLIKHISLSRYMRPNIWLKATSVVESELPAAAALIKIGPDASQPLYMAYQGPLRPHERLAVVLALAMIKDAHDRGFVNGAASFADTERYYIQEGLKLLDAQRWMESAWFHGWNRVTNASGDVVEESDFLPFGTERVITDTLDNNYKFTGHERDTESGLDHTLHRQYAPGWGPQGEAQGLSFPS